MLAQIALPPLSRSGTTAAGIIKFRLDLFEQPLLGSCQMLQARFHEVHTATALAHGKSHRFPHCLVPLHIICETAKFCWTHLL